MKARSRDDMEQALKAEVVPYLRDNKFKGSYPNFYREIDSRIDLLQIQFFRAGGACRVELSWSNANRDNIYINQHLPVNKLRVTQASVREEGRKILGAAKNSDHWFHFGQASTGEVRGSLQTPNKICKEIVQLIDAEANEWWSAKS